MHTEAYKGRPSLKSIESNGVVGAGGGGFPAARKLKTQVGTLIINAAECEPLLHKDKELLVHHEEALLSGFRTAMELTGATEGIIGIKGKYRDRILSLEKKLGSGMRVAEVADIYPAGDEFVLVHAVTGRTIPPGGLPLHVGVVVNNVETLVNIGLNRPVTHKFLTVAGAVRNPATLRVPVGISCRECLAAAGGPLDGEYDVLEGGVMMGRRLADLSEPVTKTTGGYVVLPRDHALAVRYRRDDRVVKRIGRSACDQCSFCTELCPRFLLGHPIEPHKAMRALGFMPDRNPMIMGTLYCCECNLCSLYSCPEGLDPKRVCVMGKPRARAAGLQAEGHPSPHPLLGYRQVPTSRLKTRLGLNRFDDHGSLSKTEPSPKRVTLALKQHAGAPAEPRVGPGQRVRTGDLVAAPAAGTLGAPIHASIDGVVRETNGRIVIEAA